MKSAVILLIAAFGLPELASAAKPPKPIKCWFGKMAEPKSKKSKTESKREEAERKVAMAEDALVAHDERAEDIKSLHYSIAGKKRKELEQKLGIAYKDAAIERMRSMTERNHLARNLRDAEAELAKLPPKRLKPPKSFAEWNELNKKDQKRLLEQAGYDKKLGIEVEKFDIADWEKLPKGNEDVAKLVRALKDEAGDPEDSTDDIEGSAYVGVPEASVRVFRLPDGSFIGGEVHFTQNGAMKDDGEFGTRFKNDKAAEKAGYDTGVSWSVGGTFNAELESVSGETTYWTWNGF